MGVNTQASQGRDPDTASGAAKANFEAIEQQPLPGRSPATRSRFAGERISRQTPRGEPIAARLAGQTEGLNRHDAGSREGADERVRSAGRRSPAAWVRSMRERVAWLMRPTTLQRDSAPADMSTSITLDS